MPLCRCRKILVVAKYFCGPLPIWGVQCNIILIFFYFQDGYCILVRGCVDAPNSCNRLVLFLVTRHIFTVSALQCIFIINQSYDLFLDHFFFIFLQCRKYLKISLTIKNSIKIKPRILFCYMVAIIVL